MLFCQFRSFLRFVRSVRAFPKSPGIRPEDVGPEPARGLEPLTTCLQDKCAASCATPAGNPGQPTSAPRRRNGPEAGASGPFLTPDSVVERSGSTDHAGMLST